MGNIFISSVSSLSFLFLSSLSLSLISSTISSVTFLPFSGRRHKMTHKGWHVIKPQHNQSKNLLNHWVEFNQTCYIISPHGEGVQEQHDFPCVCCPSICQSRYLLLNLGGSVGCAVRLETRRSRVQPPPRSATFFRGDWSWNIFYGHSLPSADSRRAVISFWRKNAHNTG